MKKWMLLPGILLVPGMLAAQANLALPTGTPLMVKLETTLATFSNKVGE